MPPTLYDVFQAAIAEADLINAASAILGDRWQGRVAEEAKTVRLIYKLFISGLSVHRIAKYLTEHSIPTPGGGKAWYVQAEMRRRADLGKYSGSTIFSGKIRCACCGGWYGPKVWHSKDKYKRTVYRCNEKYRMKGQKACDGPTLTEEQIHKMFITAVNRLAETVCDSSALASERDGLCGELDALSGSIERMVKENARTAMDQEAYREKEDRLCGIYAEKYERLQEVERLIEEKEDKRAILAGVAEQLQTVEGGITEFDPELWGGLVEYVEVDQHAATVVFRGGIAIGV